MITPRGGLAVMSRRKEPPNSLDYFPTPPWATRAVVEILRQLDPEARDVCDPGCGEGHMAAVLAETFSSVRAFDVFPYGYGDLRDFLDAGAWAGDRPEWFIGNPPFKVADQFITLGLQRATRGVAMLLRSNFSEGVARWHDIFSVKPPTIIAQFAERVPMVKGRWDPGASTATAYSWFIFKHFDTRPTEFRWIPPGSKARLSRLDDVRRFAVAAHMSLLEGP